MSAEASFQKVWVKKHLEALKTPVGSLVGSLELCPFIKQMNSFLSDVKLHFAFERFLATQIRAAFGFTGSPIWFKVHPRNKKKTEE